MSRDPSSSTGFDHVVAYTPAAHYGTDFTVIAEASGATLMLTRQGASRFAAVGDLATELADGQAPLAGVVLNTFRP